MESGLYKGNILTQFSGNILYLYGFDYIYAGVLAFTARMTGLSAGSLNFYAYANYKLSDNSINPNLLIS